MGAANRPADRGKVVIMPADNQGPIKGLLCRLTNCSIYKKGLLVHLDSGQHIYMTIFRHINGL